ncbi:type IV toxin-antitoxin system AbiEi family antitoxin domain-containing protein [Arthrobacter sp. LAPM80]|uniref:hypothetical protein n=1 Tax=Arthrobacter sp. LAPM80 TaxID=3141788 RepID=UPI00398AA6B9
MNTFQLLPFITAPSKFVSENGSRQLSRLAATGELVRIRHGLYLRSEEWEALPPWHKYRMRIQAVHELAVRSPVFARESAAQIMGLPLTSASPRVHTLVRPGQDGGRSGNGVQRSQAIAGDPEPWEMFGLLLTPPVQTARDLAVHLPLIHSLPAMDKLLAQQILPGSPAGVQLAFTAGNVEEAITMLPNATQRNRARRVLGVADGRSESAGESWSRAIMIQNGFPTPVLQAEFRDGLGRIGFPDFDWEEFKTLGEFDGHEKYSAQRYLNGRTPAQVVIEEKNRENRLRALGYNVVRWEWKDLKNPQRLVQLLRGAGLPQVSARKST